MRYWYLEWFCPPPPQHEHVIVDFDMNIRQVSLGQTWCLILSLVSVWSSPSYDMPVCPLLTSATAVFRISCWFLIVHLVKMFIYLPQIHLAEGVGWLGSSTWFFNPPMPGLQSRALWCCVCIINSYSTLLTWPIGSLLILFILFSMFFVLIHDCTLLYWFSLLQFWLLQLHLYMTLLYSYSFIVHICF